jgi:hypothetical protein
MPYNQNMEFIEATAFTKHVYKYLSEDEYLGLQGYYSSIRKQAKLFQVRVASVKSAGLSQEKVKVVAFG